MPDPIPDTPENIARILMTTEPPEWTYENKGEHEKAPACSNKSGLEKSKTGKEVRHIG
jgi:hypothetical protein